jgi:hypothetical protein
MRRAAPWSLVVVAGLIYGCSTMKPHGSNHPGLTDLNPNAVIRTFPASATLVARTMADVMGEDSIIVNVSMTPDAKSKEFRNFSRADREALGISPLTPANDVNYNITARSRDGHPIDVAVRLKGESGSEVSVLYGFAGDSGLSRDLLDKAEVALAKPPKDSGVAKTAGSKSAAKPAGD